MKEQKLNTVEKFFVFGLIPIVIIKIAIDLLLGYIKLW